MAVDAKLKLTIRFNRPVTPAIRGNLKQKAIGMFPGAGDHDRFKDFQFDTNASNQPIDGSGNVITLRDVVVAQAPVNVTNNYDGLQQPTTNALANEVTETYYEVNGIWYCEFCFDIEDLIEGGEGATVQICISFPM